LNAHPIKLAEIARVAELLGPLCDEDDALFHDMMEAESDLFAIVARLHAQIARDEEMLTGIAERQANLAERKRRIAERVIATKAAVGQFLRAAGLTKIELPEASYSVRDGKPKLEIVDPAAVPPEFQRMKPEPDKTKINEAFENVEALPNWLIRDLPKDVVTARKK